VDTDALSQNPAWEKIQSALAARQYKNDADVVAAEGAAQLLAGIKLVSGREAADFLLEYGRLLDEQHGAGSYDSIFRFVRFRQLMEAGPEEGARLIEQWQEERAALDAKRAARLASSEPKRSES